MDLGLEHRPCESLGRLLDAAGGEVELAAEERPQPRLVGERYAFFASTASTRPASFISSDPNVVGRPGRLSASAAHSSRDG